MMVSVLVDQINSRVEYTFDFVFAARGIEYALYDSVDAFNESQPPRLNYSNLNATAATIRPAELLNQSTIQQQSIDKSSFEGIDCIGFAELADPVASIFYTLSRYEEYLTDGRDAHGRFQFSSSILARWGWVEHVMCDRWAEAICAFAQLDLGAIDRSVKLVPTFDIDNAFAYQYKSGKRRTLSILRDWLKFDFDRIAERKRVERGGGDPYDTFEKISQVVKRFSEGKIFWLVADLGKNDRNLSIDHPAHSELIQKMDAHHQVGLHPSYQSNGEASLIASEKKRLEEVVGRKVNASRQHFLKFQLPQTPKSLIESGFLDEYSMGFAEHIGFRSGTARPHFWFDLEENAKSELLIHPFAYMDGTLLEYMQLDIDESIGRIRSLYNEVCAYGGDFVFIWHNETIGDYGRWSGWSAVLEQTIKLAK